MSNTPPIFTDDEAARIQEIDRARDVLTAERRLIVDRAKKRALRAALTTGGRA